MADGGVPEACIELSLRMAPGRLMLALYRSRPGLRAVATLTVGGGLVGALLGVLVSRPLVAAPGRAAVVGLAVGAVVMPVLVLLLGFRQVVGRSRAIGPVDRWRLEPSGITVEAAGTTEVVPWSLVDRLEMAERCTSARASVLLHRTEVAVPVEHRAMVRAWWEAARAGGVEAAIPASDPSAVPEGPPLLPPPSSILVSAVPTSAEWGRAAVVSAQRVRRAWRVLMALVCAMSTASTMVTEGVTVVTVVVTLIVLLLAAGMVWLVSKLPLDRWAHVQQGVLLKRQAERLLGPGPLTWSIDPLGLEQGGRNGKRLRFSWAAVEEIEVDGPVLRARFRSTSGWVIIPLRAFVGDQLDRTLAWAEAGRDRANPQP